MSCSITIHDIVNSAVCYVYFSSVLLYVIQQSVRVCVCSVMCCVHCQPATVVVLLLKLRLIIEPMTKTCVAFVSAHFDHFHLWLVVWNIFYFPIHWGSSSQLTFIFFRGVAQPPNSFGMFLQHGEDT